MVHHQSAVCQLKSNSPRYTMWLGRVTMCSRTSPRRWLAIVGARARADIEQASERENERKRASDSLTDMEPHHTPVALGVRWHAPLCGGQTRFAAPKSPLSLFTAPTVSPAKPPKAHAAPADPKITNHTLHSSSCVLLASTFISTLNLRSQDHNGAHDISSEKGVWLNLVSYDETWN